MDSLLAALSPEFAAEIGGREGLGRGTVAVRPGDDVVAGDLLGECGNSGNSALPHVHYHLQTGAAYREGRGLPAPFNDYFVGGQFVRRGEPTRGQLLVP